MALLRVLDTTVGVIGYGGWDGQKNSKHEHRIDAKVGNLSVAVGLTINGIGFGVSVLL